MRALELVKLWPLMARTTGRREVTIGLIDGPIATAHPDLEGQNIRELGVDGASCSRVSSAACRHGTFVAGMLVAKRGSRAPAICPGCSLVVRSIFPETITGNGQLHRLRLPGFIKDEEVGLGDAIKKVTYAMGIKPAPVAKNGQPRSTDGCVSRDNR